MPLLFEICEDTYMKAFLYASLVAGISTGVVLEYRKSNPFGLYVECDTTETDGCDEKTALTLRAILHTSFVAFLSTFIVLWVLYILFGFGRSFISKKGNDNGNGNTSDSTSSC